MSIELYRIVLAVIDQGSFARAAADLGRTEGAVSKQIKQLEQILDVPLFDRRTKPPTPTSQVLDLVPAMREAVRAQGRVRSQARLLAGSVEGEISLGVIPTVSESILAPALARLRDRYPQLRVRIENGLSGPLLEKLQNFRLDAAVVTRPGLDNTAFIFDVIAREPIILIAPGSIERSDPVELLNSHDIIRFNRNAGVGMIIDRLLREMAPGRAALIELDSIESIIQLVRFGLGVALIPEPVSSEADKTIRERDDIDAYDLPDLRATPTDELARALPVSRDVVLARTSRRTNDRLIDTVLSAFRDTVFRR